MSHSYTKSQSFVLSFIILILNSACGGDPRYEASGEAARVLNSPAETYVCIGEFLLQTFDVTTERENGEVKIVDAEVSEGGLVTGYAVGGVGPRLSLTANDGSRWLFVIKWPEKRYGKAKNKSSRPKKERHHFVKVVREASSTQAACSKAD